MKQHVVLFLQEAYVQATKTERLFMKTIIAIGLSIVFSTLAFAFETHQSIDWPDYEKANRKFAGSNPDVPTEKTEQFYGKFLSFTAQDEENDLELSDKELRRATRKVGAQFLLLYIIEALTFTSDGINMPVNLTGDNIILESDNLDDEEDNIKYTVKAKFKNIKIKNLFISGMLSPKKNNNGIPVWSLTLMLEEIGTCADVDATAEKINGELDGSYLDLIPKGTASTSGEACLTIKNARVPVEVTIARDEDDDDDDDDRIVSRFTVIPFGREHELDEGTKKLEVQLNDLTAYNYVVSQLILDLLEPAVEDLLYNELDIDELLSEVAEEVLEVPLSFGEKK